MHLLSVALHSFSPRFQLFPSSPFIPRVFLPRLFLLLYFIIFFSAFFQVFKTDERRLPQFRREPLLAWRLIPYPLRCSHPQFASIALYIVACITLCWAFKCQPGVHMNACVLTRIFFQFFCSSFFQAFFRHCALAGFLSLWRGRVTFAVILGSMENLYKHGRSYSGWIRAVHYERNARLVIITSNALWIAFWFFFVWF